MSKTTILAAAIAACAVLSACAGITVKADVNTALIGQVHCGSYAWAGGFHGNSALRSTVANPVNEARLREAIASHLGGNVLNTGAAADCLVGYGIGAHQVMSGYYPYYGWGYGPYWGAYGGGPYVYTQGVIAVDVYDARSRQPLWHAWADESLSGVSGEEAAKRIDAAVAAIFAKGSSG
ncbi:MAG TPA: DUF4136 domain-containing protein [Steroidobacteraceae bacterium]|nr:DUF4136 domain-containing protein [Steroidobacteraceae bacterium]